MAIGQRKEEGGVPRWMVTFADLMALLLVFFILLFSMSVVDIVRYQAVVESITTTLSGKPVAPTVIDLEGVPEPVEPDEPEVTMATPIEEVMLALQDELSEEINQGLVDVIESAGQLLVRFEEKAAFPSGSADLNTEFLPILRRIAWVIGRKDSHLRITGHTDDVPIRTERFRSNWDLSTARAVSVVHFFEATGFIEPERMVAQGHAETLPLAPNDTPENRARNRRVDVIVTER